MGVNPTLISFIVFIFLLYFFILYIPPFREGILHPTRKPIEAPRCAEFLGDIIIKKK
jgi:hypothetical protein